MRLLLSLVVLLAVVSPAAAQTAARETVVAQAVEAVFNAIEKRLINDYFAKKAIQSGKVKLEPGKAGWRSAICRTISHRCCRRSGPDISAMSSATTWC